MKGISAALLLVVSGCSLAPEFTPLETKLPDSYQSAPTGESVANVPWWEIYSDTELQRLIDQALKENNDLSVALSRIEQAQGILTQTRAQQFPELRGNASLQRSRPSQEVIFFTNNAFNLLTLGGDLAFEADLWGRLRDATKAERARLLGSEYAKRTVTLALVSQVASNYILLGDLNTRLALARRTLESRQASTRIQRAKFAQGVIPLIDVNQTELLEQDAVVSLASLARAKKQAKNALLTLLGDPTFEIPEVEALPEIKESLPVGVPADLLLRRPDVLAAEQSARAAVAQIGVARAAQYPSLSLRGFLGLQSREENKLLTGSPVAWNLGADILGPFIDFNRRAAAVDVATARADQAYAEYRQALLTALQEVNDSLVNVETFHSEYEARRTQRLASESIVKLARARYEDGVSTHLEVLDSERTLFDVGLMEIQARSLYLSSYVQLYRALGGGWQLR